MKNSRKIIAGLLVAAGLVTAGAIAYADPEGYGPGWGGHHHGMAGPGMMSAGAMGPDMMAPGAMGPALMGGDHHGATQAHSTGAQSTPERLSQRAEFAKQRAASMEAMTAALKDLYAALTPEQKTIADQYFGRAHMSQFSPRGHRHGH